MNRYILSLDQGTTSSRAIVFDQTGHIVSTAQKEFTQHFPKAGWVEHDPAEIWSTQAGVAAEAIAALHGAEIAAIGITNQRETTIVWNRKTGKPVYNAIVWQDRRTAGYCDQLKAEGREEFIRGKTGLVIDAYFSATKIRWILENVPGARGQDLAFGTVDSWLVWNLTGGQAHVTDVSNASRTLLFNIHTLDWDDELLDLFGIPRNMMPQVRASSEVYGQTKTHFLTTGVPVSGMAGDQQAALFGQLCTRPGMVKNTYGTGCFMLMNVGGNCPPPKGRLLTTVAWSIGGKTEYAVEGSIFIAGAVVQWLRDGLGIIRASSDVEGLAGQVRDTEGVYFVPSFTGLGAPYWNPHATGLIVGLTRGTKAAHLARAALESMAFQTMDVLKAMEAAAGRPVTELRVDGGATANNLLMQFQSDVLQIPVIRPTITETTALGAAYLAGLAVGYWKDLDAISSFWQKERVFNPSLSKAEIQPHIEGWNRAVDTAISWTNTKTR